MESQTNKVSTALILPIILLMVGLVLNGCQANDEEVPRSQPEKEEITPPKEEKQIKEADVEMKVPSNYFSLGEIVNLSKKSYNFNLIYKLGNQNEIDDIQIAYNPLFEWEFEREFQEGKVVNEGIQFQMLHTASKEDPFAAWYLGNEQSNYRNFAVVSNEEMIEKNEFYFILVKSFHTTVTEFIDEDGNIIDNIKDDSPDYEVYD